MTQNGRSPFLGVDMKLFSIVASTFLLFPWPAAVADELALSTENDGACPVTLGPEGALEPGLRYMYGSDAFAVSLPADGIWPVTAPNARIAVKLFWRSAGFRPGMEEHLQVTIVNLNGGPNDAVVKGITNANSVPSDMEQAQFDDEWQDGWLMLAGIDFPSPGCWKVTGDYLDQTLTFTVKTIHSTD